MNQDHHEHAASTLIFNLGIIACVFFFASIGVAAQGRIDRPPTPAERMRERQLRRETQMETNTMIEALRKDSRQLTKEERSPLAYVQLQKDFEHLQTVHNQMMVMTFANKVLDYKLISEASTEIRKRAVRLKSNLPLPEPEEDKQKEESLKGWDELDQGQVKPALLALDDLIMRFVKNPVFQKPEVIDLRQSSQATRDLDAIIKLSGKIKKSADKLTKAPQ